MAQRKLTWKNDPRANDHSGLLSTALGRKVVVKGTRVGKVQRGVVATELGTYSHELYRHASSPFEVTLVASVRSETSLPIDKANRVIIDATRSYVQNITNAFDRNPQGLTRDEVDRQNNTIQTVGWKIEDFAPRLYNTLDTLRCAELANKQYLRSGCVDIVMDELKKEFDDKLTTNGAVRGYSATNNAIWLTVVGTLIGDKSIVRSIQASKWYHLIDQDSVDLDKVAIIASDYIEACKAKNLESAQDVVTKSMSLSIDLLHVLANFPREKGGGKEINLSNTSSPDIDVAYDDDSGGEEVLESGGGRSGAIQGTEFTNATNFTFDEALETQWRELTDDLMLKEKQAKENKKVGYIGGLESKPSNLERTVTVDDTDGKTDVKRHSVKMLNFTQEAVKLNANTVNLLEDVERSGYASRHRSGYPTPDLWQLKRLGNTKVFGKAPKKSGKLLMLVDASGSMGDGYHESDNGYLAYQASSAIAEAFPNAETYAFNSSDRQCYIYPLQNGFMLGKQAKIEGFRHGGNTDCSALLFMEQMMLGQFQDSLAVIISDGSPNSPSPLDNSHLRSHTRNVSYRLHDQGLRFVSVLVGGYEDSSYYPSDVTVQLRNVADMQKVGEAIQRIGMTFK